MDPVLKYDRRMKNLNRFAGLNMIKQTNLQEHGYMTAMIFKDLCDTMNIDCSLEIFIKVMRHDIAEVFTGDVLFPAKNLTPEVSQQWAAIEDTVMKNHHGGVLKDYSGDEFVKSFSKIQLVLWKLADYLDGWYTVKVEQLVGNKDPEVSKCAATYADAMSRAINHLDPVSIETILDYIEEFMRV